MKKIVIIGAGPTGLGAAYRLNELGYENFILYESNQHAGGLCSSFKDKKGFTWDLGGHVIFSHYDYFDRLFKIALKNDYLKHRREAWILANNIWIPYPFQNNLKYLPKKIAQKCLRDLKKAHQQRQSSKNFKEWILNNFGNGIAEYFMVPYNLKVWAHPLEMLSFDWVDERVSRIAHGEAARLLLPDSDKPDWGPNAEFKYPLYGGTGQIFRGIASLLKEKIKYNSKLIYIDSKLKELRFSNGRVDKYDILINTSPLDTFVKLLNRPLKKSLLDATANLFHNGVYVVGIGISKHITNKKCWVYFPNKNSPFFRVTYLSNYSPNNVPMAKKYYSLLCETSYSTYKPEMKSKIIEKTIQGLINTGLLVEQDTQFIVSKFLFDIDYAYPIPTLGRDAALKTIQTKLEKMLIFSRGRFGAWKYEIGNTDHSVVQGKEVIDRILGVAKEKVWSF